MEKSTVSRNLKRLEQLSFVRRNQGANPNSVSYEVTSAGVEAIDAAFPVWQRGQARLTQLLGEALSHQVVELVDAHEPKR